MRVRGHMAWRASLPVQRPGCGVRLWGKEGNALIENDLMPPVFLAFVTGIGSIAVALGNLIARLSPPRSRRAVPSRRTICPISPLRGPLDSKGWSRYEGHSHSTNGSYTRFESEKIIRAIVLLPRGRSCVGEAAI